MQLPDRYLQSSLDTVWPFRFTVLDDTDALRVYEAERPVFDLLIPYDVDLFAKEPYWGPYSVVWVSPQLGPFRYRKPLYFGPAVSLMTWLITYNDLDAMTLLDNGLPLEEWESLVDLDN